jgi:hypothetical protein
MQKSTKTGIVQDQSREKSVMLAYRNMDNLAIVWSVGIGIGYAFLVFFTFWIGYRCVLIWGAYRGGTTRSSLPN